MKRNRKNSGMTLIELVISIGLLGAIMMSAHVITAAVYNTSSHLQKEMLPMMQANLTIETIVQRMLRAPKMQVGTQYVSYVIGGSGDSLTFHSATVNGNDLVNLEGDKVVYRPYGGEPQTLMHGVSSIKFDVVHFNRLRINLQLTDGSALSSSVFPRNQDTPQSTIN
ncbi:MAG: prepilin-type N-terminal cleavage/methylation domain-containing protein [Elusimicrobia bacterium]|nr:prepilin-type N-terminal cleavage/methylation domain-containing protein [Elusimicrobiota bacterium]